MKGRKYRIALFNLGSGLLTTVAEQGTNAHKARVWSPDGRRLAYPKRGRLAVFDTETEEETVVLDTKPWGQMSFRRSGAYDVLGWIDEDRIAFLKVHEVDTSEVEKYGHGAIYTHCNLAGIDTRTGEVIQLTDDGPIVNGASLSTLRP